MITTRHDASRSRRRASRNWFAPGAVIVAVAAATTLAACGPRDEAPPSARVTTSSTAHR